MKFPWFILIFLGPLVSGMVGRSIDDFSGNIWAGWFVLIGVAGGIMSGIVIGLMIK